MKSIVTFCLLVLFVAPSPVFAGAGHNHGPKRQQIAITEAEAAKRAAKMVEVLASEQKIDASWVGIKESSVEQKKFNNIKEWQVVYNNDGIEDPSKRILFVFLSLSGEYIAANYTGN